MYKKKTCQQVIQQIILNVYHIKSLISIVEYR